MNPANFSTMKSYIHQYYSCLSHTQIKKIEKKNRERHHSKDQWMALKQEENVSSTTIFSARMANQTTTIFRASFSSLDNLTLHRHLNHFFRVSQFFPPSIPGNYFLQWLECEDFFALELNTYLALLSRFQFCSFFELPYQAPDKLSTNIK